MGHLTTRRSSHARLGNLVLAGTDAGPADAGGGGAALRRVGPDLEPLGELRCGAGRVAPGVGAGRDGGRARRPRWRARRAAESAGGPLNGLGDAPARPVARRPGPRSADLRPAAAPPAPSGDG